MDKRKAFNEYAESRRTKSRQTFSALLQRTQQALFLEDQEELRLIEENLLHATKDALSSITVLKQMDAALRWEVWMAFTYDDVNPWSPDQFTMSKPNLKHLHFSISLFPKQLYNIGNRYIHPHSGCNTIVVIRIYFIKRVKCYNGNEGNGSTRISMKP